MPNKAVSDKLDDLFDLVRAQYDEMAAETPARSRAAKTAKIICRNRGKSPDVITTGIPGNTPVMGGNDVVAVCHPIQPAWATYWREAEAAIRAVDEADG